MLEKCSVRFSEEMQAVFNKFPDLLHSLEMNTRLIPRYGHEQAFLKSSHISYASSVYSPPTETFLNNPQQIIKNVHLCEASTRIPLEISIKGFLLVFLLLVIRIGYTL
jgi:hypothetical protein